MPIDHRIKGRSQVYRRPPSGGITNGAAIHTNGGDDTTVTAGAQITLPLPIVAYDSAGYTGIIANTLVVPTDGAYLINLQFNEKLVNDDDPGFPLTTGWVGARIRIFLNGAGGIYRASAAWASIGFAEINDTSTPASATEYYSGRGLSWNTWMPAGSQVYVWVNNQTALDILVRGALSIQRLGDGQPPP